MQIVHDSSGKKKPMQVVDDGKETKLKKFDGATVPEQEVQDNSEVEEVIDDTQVVHEEQKTESTPTQPEAESEEQEEAEESVAKPKKRNVSYQNRINELVKRANEAERQRNDYYNRNLKLEADLKKKNGEKLIQSGFDITEEQLEKIILQGKKTLEIVNIDPINKGPYLLVTLLNDKNENKVVVDHNAFQ